MKILILSNSKENITKIKQILEAKDYTLLVKEMPERLTTNYFSNIFSGDENHKDIKLIILDITGQETFTISSKSTSKSFGIRENISDQKPSYVQIFKIINKYDFAKLIILSLNQKDILSSGEIKFDDFVFFSHLKEELAVRINLVLARHKILPPKNSIIVGELILNLDKYELTIGGKEVELTFKEYELLKFLLQNQDKVFSRNKLLSIIWGYDFYGGSRTVDVHIRRLRSKIGPPYSLMLKTIINVGYMFSPKI